MDGGGGGEGERSYAKEGKKLIKWDQYQYLGNCQPTPLLTQH